LYNRTHQITAEFATDDDPVDGVLVSQGNVLGGWVLFVRDGSVSYVHNYVGLSEHRLSAPFSFSPGRHAITFRFSRTEDHAGVGSLLVDGDVVATGEIAPFTPMRFSLTGAGVTLGYSGHSPVCDDVRSPSQFTGDLYRVIIDVDGESPFDPAGEAAISITTQ
jgi:arylsulfatase